ncbi:hypothetical protein FTV88_0630 [Heliorestis convoluta]|uniref:Uncharacterized protein n=1 Tax=Heliorestis convoluta TaxID=356322 RepID=A0A5Q2MZC9_9FIRM|nr:hypothetical protein FTV88_0630 [Heliorestis convoluta]
MIHCEKAARKTFWRLFLQIGLTKTHGINQSKPMAPKYHVATEK